MYLSTAETCGRLRLSRWTISKLVRSGELQAVKGPKRNSPLRISEESIVAYIARHTISPSTPQPESVLVEHFVDALSVLADHAGESRSATTSHASNATRANEGAA